jgi:hypothetical protein
VSFLQVEVFMQGKQGGGVAGAQTHLQPGDHHPGVIDHRPGLRDPGCQRGRAFGFQRVAGADQPPHPVQPEPLERLAGDMGMAGMGRIERPAEQADDHARFCRRKALPHLCLSLTDKVPHCPLRPCRQALGRAVTPPQPMSGIAGH